MEKLSGVSLREENITFEVPEGWIVIESTPIRSPDTNILFHSMNPEKILAESESLLLGYLMWERIKQRGLFVAGLFQLQRLLEHTDDIPPSYNNHNFLFPGTIVYTPEARNLCIPSLR